jgi:hypothetical protein
MKSRTLPFAAFLVLADGLQAHSQGIDPVMYQRWVRQQQLEAQARRLKDSNYRSYYGLNSPRYYMPPVPDMVSRSKSYYRGPGGEVVDFDHLPKNALSKGFRYMGSYSSTHPAPRGGK